MRLLAISDLHLGFEANRSAILEVARHPDDWLILAGDVAERRSHIEFAFEILTRRFRKLVWVPGNHELWTLPSGEDTARGRDRYDGLVKLCRSYGVLTPEDPYPVISIDGQDVRLAPLFLLYDYSFRPPEISFEEAVKWANEGGTMCADEVLLHPDPYSCLAEWCRARCALTEARLSVEGSGLATILINHFPLREDLARVPLFPRFSLWCGTSITRDWHLRFNAKVVVSGHLHIPSTKFFDGTRFEEVSLGYPRQWIGRTSFNRAIREILPWSGARGR